MNYIVFDLEWNQAADLKTRRENRLLFEIIEIGAIKLNEKKNCWVISMSSSNHRCFMQ